MASGTTTGSSLNCERGIVLRPETSRRSFLMLYLREEVRPSSSRPGCLKAESPSVSKIEL
jgi:hypothetical protein